MIIKIDSSQLEWRSYLEWSGDPVGIKEIKYGVDIHSRNMEDLALPERLEAKVFLFRCIYWGPAWAYANSNDFMHISNSTKFWQGVIDKFFEKYSVLYSFQKNLVKQATNGEVITIPTGREYMFAPKQRDSRFGPELYFHNPDIVNWPNQGFAADLMILARVALYNRLLKLGMLEEKVLWINTIHDDIELDVDNNPELLYTISMECENVMRDIPANFYRVYKKEFTVPMDGEVKFGHNLKDLIKFDRKFGEIQFNVN